LINRHLKLNPLERLGLPQEKAGVVWFLGTPTVVGQGTGNPANGGLI
jgi:hypothetical protein